MNVYKLYYFLAVIFILLTEFVGNAYRSFIYANGIYDFGIADIHTNIGAVLVASFLFMGFAKYNSYQDELRIILGAVLGFIFYEFLQLMISYLVFDLKDIIGTIIGGGITIILHRIIRVRFTYVNTP